MKLFNRLNIYFISSLILILIIGGFTQYLYVSKKVNKRLQKTLIKEKKLLTKQIKDLDEKDNFTFYKTEESSIELSKKKSTLDNIFSIQYIFDEEDQETIKFLVLDSRVKGNQNYYNIQIKKPFIQANDFISSMIFSLLITLGILFTIYSIFNRIISRKIFSPFYITLNQLKKYDLESGEKIHFSEDIQTLEFNFLNKELNEMTNKINAFFENQKQFSENAAHELQTPLSIIRSKAELLLQSDNLTDKALAEINTILSSVDRISKINQALVTLSKIENHDFSTDQEIDINTIIKDNLKDFQWIIDEKNIKLEYSEYDIFKLKIHEDWALILISNLLKNAIGHNFDNGWINIEITKSKIIIKNSGHALLNDPNNYFKRFTKGEKSSTTGLGLSIIKDICKKTNLDIQYLSKEQQHKIILSKTL